MPPSFAEALNRISLERGAYGTTSIEGNTLTKAEVRDIVEGRASTPPSRAYQRQEIENLVSLFNDIIQECLPDNAPPLSATRLKAQHARLMVGQPEKENVVPGAFRTHDVLVGRYRGAPPEDCEYLVDRLCEWLNNELSQLGDDHALRTPMAFILATLAHLHLTWIHPFGDGNGRMSRLLEFELLIRAGVPVPAAHLLSDHYNKTRDMYYSILEQTSVRPGYPAEDFVHYAVQGLVDGLREQIVQVQEMQLSIMWQSYVHERFHGQHTQARTRMRDLVLALPADHWTPIDDVTILNRSLAEAYRSKTSKTVTRDINGLVKMGLVEKQRGRGVRPRVEVMSAFLPPRRDPSAGP
ncbi:Fic family protein [Actinomyces sp.]|uniref:Fic family protein n=1 Tax=Actinomyces sp. TaxID=29317 RepID=UPI0026DD9E53|nr:Fic family protein [Actinomyces sp.]